MVPLTGEGEFASLSHRMFLGNTILIVADYDFLKDIFHSRSRSQWVRNVACFRSPFVTTSQFPPLVVVF